VLRFHWTMNPLYAQGLYATEGNKENGVLLKIDKLYRFPDDYPFVLDGRFRSPWYDEQERRSANKRELAQEVDIDYSQSGFQFFEQQMIEKWKKEQVLPAFHRGELLLKPDWKHPEWFEHARGAIQLWFHPDIDGKVPKAWDDIACGVDVATGKGGEMSSNSVASFVRRSTGEKIAQFTTNALSPTEFAKVVFGLCSWFNEAFLIFEENGPGGEFAKQVKELGYRKVFMRNDDETKFVSKKTKKPGWWSDKDNKKILLADYRNALMIGRFLNRCEEALTECSQYVHQPGGKVEHSRSMTKDDPTISGENHGDMTIADALANRGIHELDRMKTQEKDEPDEPPPGSFGARRLDSLQKVSNRPRKWGDFSRRAG
jgi:hypothetical protein